MSRRGALAALGAVAAVGCSLLIDPEPAVQCASDTDCVAQLAGRVCRQGFCVAEADAATADANPDAARDGGSEPDAADAADASDPAALEPGPGDVVMLLPDGIVAEDHSHVTAWNNSVPGTTLRTAVVSADNPSQSSAQPQLIDHHGNACAAFDLYQRMVLTDDAAGGLAPTGDFSVTIVVATPALEEGGEYSSAGRVPVGRVQADAIDSDSFQATGWALRTAWQATEQSFNQDRFAASIVLVGGGAAANVAREVLDPDLHDDQLHVLSLVVRSDGGEGSPRLHLWVDGAEKGAPLPFAKAQPTTADLALGSLFTPPYQWTAFLGDLCTVIVHHGPETDAELGARTQALLARFGLR